MHHIGIILFPGFQVLNLAATTVFEFANLALDEPHYKISLLSEKGGSIASSAGFSVSTDRFSDAAFDTVLVVGNNDVEPVSSGLINFLREVAPRSRRIGSTCTGAFILAEAGLLDGRRATTHWFHARNFQRAFPNVKMEEDRIFIIDGPVWTSAGMTSCIDLALALVEKDLGTDIAKSVARKLVVYHRRAGGQSQYSALLELDPKSDRIQKSSHLCQGKPAQGAIRRATRGSRSSEPTPVQQGVSGGNGSITRQGYREPARGGGAVDD